MGRTLLGAEGQARGTHAVLFDLLLLLLGSLGQPLQPVSVQGGLLACHQPQSAPESELSGHAQGQASSSTNRLSGE